MNNVDVGIGVSGGIGIGLLVGSEFSGSFVTIVGGIVTLGALAALVLFSYKDRNKGCP